MIENIIIKNDILEQLTFTDALDYNNSGVQNNNTNYKTASLNTSNMCYRIYFKAISDLTSNSNTHLRVNAFNIDQDTNDELFVRCLYDGIFGNNYQTYISGKTMVADIICNCYDIIKISISKRFFEILYIEPYELNYNNSIICKLEPGGVSDGAALLYNTSNYYRSRIQKLIRVTPDSNICIKLEEFSQTAIDSISNIKIMALNDQFVKMNNTVYGKTINNGFDQNQYYYAASNIKYIYIMVSYGNFKIYSKDYGYIKVYSDKDICNVYMPDSPNNKYTDNLYPSIASCYEVSDSVLSSFRLMLPPNYSVTGAATPLIVFVHGSGGMLNWNDTLGYGNNADADYRPYLDYLCKEGFAVFDCYPWTNKYYNMINTNTWSPFAIPNIINAYLEGIKYVCSRYNIDIDKVSLICKSQGGHIGGWAMGQHLFKFKAIMMFATSNATNFNNIFFNSNCRSAILNYVDFVGTSEEKQTFISNGSLSNDTVREFINKNKNIYVNMMPFTHGVIGSNIDELFDLATNTVSTVPDWMVDDGIPVKYNTNNNPVPIAQTLFKYAIRSDLIKVSYYPVKFWCAFDDASVSSYCNYAIYKWLTNSGSEAYFRELPLDTGGHHAMDTSDSALKSTGTTKLGIEYSDIPLAYVEAVEFIRSHNGD